jgi:hypothetical protein
VVAFDTLKKTPFPILINKTQWKTSLSIEWKLFYHLLERHCSKFNCKTNTVEAFLTHLLENVYFPEFV